MPAYYAMGYLSGVLFRVTTIGEHPHAKTPNARRQPLGRAGATKERTLFPVGWTPLLGSVSAPGGLEKWFLTPFLLPGGCVLEMPGPKGRLYFLSVYSEYRFHRHSCPLKPTSLKAPKRACRPSIGLLLPLGAKSTSAVIGTPSISIDTLVTSVIVTVDPEESLTIVGFPLAIDSPTA